ncbi:restriction endonuclease [Micromonospora sp. CPCC 206060]|uniref:restriction endonuclease n=1 Tax=Micromonospora sp. CPCC 206060 TaxID=3122406 RepID=UPI002FF391AB
MHRVRSYRRRDGTRVRSHLRRSSGRSRASARRRRPTRRDSGGLDYRLLLGAFVAVLTVVVVLAVVEFVQRHPVWSAFIGLVLVSGAVAVVRFIRREQARRAAEQAERDRRIGVTDAMTGTEFEHWFGRLLAASGCTGVTVCGGAGDRGADILATAPDGRRVVVQCKRRSPGNRVGSAEIQRFAGTCRSVHGGDICLLVTNGSFTDGDGLLLARQLDILLVDRAALETWAYTGRPPLALVARWQP